MKFIVIHFGKIALNKADVEALWTLKSLSENLTQSDIVRNKDRLTFNDTFRQGCVNYSHENQICSLTTTSISNYMINNG